MSCEKVYALAPSFLFSNALICALINNPFQQIPSRFRDARFKAVPKINFRFKDFISNFLISLRYSLLILNAFLITLTLIASK